MRYGLSITRPSGNCSWQSKVGRQRRTRSGSSARLPLNSYGPVSKPRPPSRCLLSFRGDGGFQRLLWGRVAEYCPSISSGAVRLRSPSSRPESTRHRYLPKISNCVFDLGVSKQYLDSSEVTGRLVDRGSLGTTEQMRSVFVGAQSNRSNPFID